MLGDRIARTLGATWLLFTWLLLAGAAFTAAPAWAADTAPKVDQQTFRDKVDAVRKTIQTERGSSPSPPVSDAVDICKINPRLPQCSKP